jgi:hypothetical protein
MERVMSKHKATIIAIIALFATAVTSPAMAIGKTDPPATAVKYLGFIDENPVFELTLNNNSFENYLVSIRDVSGTVIFSEKLSGKNISRKYRIDTNEEIPEGGLRFEVKSVKSKKTDIYLASVTENVTREVAVTKL